uniref:Ubiquitin-conjugating enzyme E2Q-like protein 1 n=1 Tax=Eptatretus burgeri TaxID=7764 RepID=A0A8C4QSQ2_EPTBU
MATLLRKIGLIRLSEPESGSPKGSRKAGKGSSSSGGHHQRPSLPNGPVIAAAPAQNSAQPEAGRGDGRSILRLPTASGIATPQPSKIHGMQVRAKRLMKELQDLNKLGDEMLVVELVGDNLFEWNVKLFQIDHDSPLWQDMRETGIDYILLNLTFPENFPFSPPFMRVLSPRIDNGFVLDGGAICMELLTPRGWSSAYTVEAVVRQFAASLIKGQGRICRKTKKAFSKKEAEATFKSLVKTHEKYGWVTPPSSEG